MTDQRDLAKEVERIVAAAEQHGDNTIYSLSDIKMLLLQIASQSRELEELRSENYAMSQDDGKLERELERLRKLNIQLGTARQPVGHPEWVDAVRNRALHYPDGAMLDDIYALLGQVDELRRPVVQSEEIELIRRDPPDRLSPVCEWSVRSAATPGLKIDAKGDLVWWHTHRLREAALLSALDQAQREIARLSSPPEERREIAERRKLGYSSASVHLLEMYNLALADIDTLIQDLRRYSNAHAILLAERDEARQSLRQESELHQARKDLVTQQAARIERLEGAKNTCVVLLQQLHQRLWDLGLCQTSISRTLLDEAISALAAADGQRDLLTAEQVLSTLTPEQRAATEALRQQMFGDLPIATGDGVEGE